MELQHDIHCLNNIINPIPPLVAMEEEEQEQLVPMDNHKANAMSSVDSDHSEA